MMRRFIMSCPICDTPIYEDDEKVGNPGWYYHRYCHEAARQDQQAALSRTNDDELFKLFDDDEDGDYIPAPDNWRDRVRQDLVMKQGAGVMDELIATLEAWMKYADEERNGCSTYTPGGQSYWDGKYDAYRRMLEYIKTGSDIEQ